MRATSMHLMRVRLAHVRGERRAERHRVVQHAFVLHTVEVDLVRTAHCYFNTGALP